MNRGDIYLINLEPTIGCEIKKTRPAVIVSNNDIGILPLKIIVPITDWKDKYSESLWMVKIIPDNINYLSKESCIDCLQVRSVSKERFIKKIGIITEEMLEEINKSLSIVLCINF